MENILVAGAGGFIGGHLVSDLLGQGCRVVAVDIKPLERWHQLHPSADNRSLDLKFREACLDVSAGCNVIYNLACNMGGIGFIENHRALCMLSVLINTHLLMAARENGVGKYFFASSACVYNSGKQDSPDVEPLKEEDAYPAMPESGYGWEKLFGERMCTHFREDFGLDLRIARFHNVYGPHGTYVGGREKAPAALCRKAIAAKMTGGHRVKIWGDGKQTRSFLYIDDCIEGIRRLSNADFHEPVNLGSAEAVTIDHLVDIIEEIAGIRLTRDYILNTPQGVRGRNSDNTLLRKVIEWEPGVPLREGMNKLYDWIFQQMMAGAR